MEAGILGMTEGGRSYDRFGGRLIFPIWNLSGHVIAFGGRILPSGDAGAKVQTAKYVNSPESPFYHKSKVLYGLNFARNEMDKTGEVVLVEGYMDLLSLWQAGIRNAVAVSGTALTKEHVHILSRFVRKAYLFFDGDAAGRKAVRRSLEPLLAAGHRDPRAGPARGGGPRQLRPEVRRRQGARTLRLRRGPHRLHAPRRRKAVRTP